MHPGACTTRLPMPLHMLRQSSTPLQDGNQGQPEASRATKHAEATADTGALHNSNELRREAPPERGLITEASRENSRQPSHQNSREPSHQTSREPSRQTSREPSQEASESSLLRGASRQSSSETLQEGLQAGALQVQHVGGTASQGHVPETPETPSEGGAQGTFNAAACQGGGQAKPVETAGSGLAQDCSLSALAAAARLSHSEQPESRVVDVVPDQLPAPLATGQARPGDRQLRPQRPTARVEWSVQAPAATGHHAGAARDVSASASASASASLESVSHLPPGSQSVTDMQAGSLSVDDVPAGGPAGVEGAAAGVEGAAAANESSASLSPALRRDGVRESEAQVPMAGRGVSWCGALVATDDAAVSPTVRCLFWALGAPASHTSHTSHAAPHGGLRSASQPMPRQSSSKRRAALLAGVAAADSDTEAGTLELREELPEGSGLREDTRARLARLRRLQPHERHAWNSLPSAAPVVPAPAWRVAETVTRGSLDRLTARRAPAPATAPVQINWAESLRRHAAPQQLAPPRVATSAPPQFPPASAALRGCRPGRTVSASTGTGSGLHRLPPGGRYGIIPGYRRRASSAGGGVARRPLPPAPWYAAGSGRRHGGGGVFWGGASLPAAAAPVATRRGARAAARWRTARSAHVTAPQAPRRGGGCTSPEASMAHALAAAAAPLVGGQEGLRSLSGLGGGRQLPQRPRAPKRPQQTPHPHVGTTVRPPPWCWPCAHPVSRLHAQQNTPHIRYVKCQSNRVCRLIPSRAWMWRTCPSRCALVPWPP